MRVIHVVPSVDDNAPGRSYSVVQLRESLIETAADARLAALKGALGADRFSHVIPSRDESSAACRSTNKGTGPARTFKHHAHQGSEAADRHDAADFSRPFA